MAQMTKTAAAKSKGPAVLVGYGFDIHNLSKTSKGLVLGGVSFLAEPATVAHSDGDLVLHAIANAVLGALCLGDIGLYFSDKDPANKRIDSRKILAFAIKKMDKEGYAIGNIDIQIVAEEVMISPKRALLTASLSELLDCHRVNVKGTRWEKASNQVACHAVLTLFKS